MRPDMFAAVLAIVLAPISASSSFAAQAGCQQSPVQELLPDVVGPMMGADPAWLVSDLPQRWAGADAPVKTLWVVRRTDQPLRITGQRVDGPGVARLRRGSAEPADALDVPNAAQHSVRPGGATRDLMSAYAFLSSHVFYPSPGCWRFEVRVGDQIAYIVREVTHRQ
jgi:hypothetical protein